MQASRRCKESAERRRGVSHGQYCWQASLWGHHVLCYEHDQHLYLDHRSVGVTPTEFGLIWLLLKQALGAELAVTAVEGGGFPALYRHLQQIGVVPVAALLRAMTSDLLAITEEWRSMAAGEPLQGTVSDAENPAGRKSLTSHLDRLRAKLRPHGLDIGTVLLMGRSAHGYLLVPLAEGSLEGRMRS